MQVNKYKEKLYINRMMLGFSEARFSTNVMPLQTLCLSETFYGIIHFVIILQTLCLSESLQTLCLSETFHGIALFVTNVMSLRDFSWNSSEVSTVRENCSLKKEKGVPNQFNGLDLQPVN